MWIVYALGAVMSTTILALLFRTVALRSENTRAFSFLFNVTALFISIILMLITGVGTIHIDTYLLILLFVSGLSYGVFQRYQFTLRKVVEASVFQTIATPASAVGYILAIAWLGESISLQKCIGYGCILFGLLIVINPKKSDFVFNKSVVAIFLITSALSIAGTIDRRVSPQFSSALTYATILWLFQVIAVGLPFIPLHVIRSELKLHTWRIPLLAATNALALLLTVAALRLAPVSRVLPILSSNIIFIALLGIFVLKERARIPQKVLAATIMFVGLFFVSR